MGRSSWLCVAAKAEALDAVLPAVNFGRSLNGKERRLRQEAIISENVGIVERLKNVASVIGSEQTVRRRPETSSGESPGKSDFLPPTTRRGPYLFREVLSFPRNKKKVCATVRAGDGGTLELEHVHMATGHVYRMVFTHLEAARVLGDTLAPELLAPPNDDDGPLPFGLKPVGIDLRREAWRHLALKATPTEAHRISFPEEEQQQHRRQRRPPLPRRQQQQADLPLLPVAEEKQARRRLATPTTTNKSKDVKRKNLFQKKKSATEQKTIMVPPDNNKKESATSSPVVVIDVPRPPVARPSPAVVLGAHLRRGTTLKAPKKKKSVFLTMESLKALASCVADTALGAAMAFRSLEAYNATTDPEAIARIAAKNYQATLNGIKRLMLQETVRRQSSATILPPQLSFSQLSICGSSSGPPDEQLQLHDHEQPPPFEPFFRSSPS